MARILVWLAILFASCVRAEVRIGSKQMTESIVLGEMLEQWLKFNNLKASHEQGLGGGGTQVLFKALVKGDIDAYVEYSGTLTRDIFAEYDLTSLKQVQQKLLALGLKATKPLGFNNNYALGIPQKLAKKLKINNMSDLATVPSLRFGLSQEFIERTEGWPTLHTKYQLFPKNLSVIDHELGYRAINNGQIDVMDLYTTDAEIKAYDLLVLGDDRNQFPVYEALWLYRLDVAKRQPEFASLISAFEGKISTDFMIKLNEQAKLKKIPEAIVAKTALKKMFNIETTATSKTVVDRILKCTKEHLILVITSLLLSIGLGLPLGLLAAKKKRLSPFILGLFSLMQTIPSLALLVFMIPLFGIGQTPAIVAIVLYSMLPIIRNTHAGLHNIAPSLKESALALGLSNRARMWSIELPLASRLILAGIKTTAVLNVGAATLGALIGAGGYGQLILTGIRLDDLTLILQGAVPAAGLALLVQALFDHLEKWMIPKGLRLSVS